MTPIASPMIPPLRPGDRLDAAEFERRWEAMPELKKAELIDGVVFMAAALRYDVHSLPHAALMGWLTYYWTHTPGVLPGDNPTLRLDEKNRPQPDAVLMLPVSGGGQARIDEGYIVGGPELVCEVAASSLATDRTAKLRTYRRHRIREYLIWDVEGRQIEWLALRDGQYAPLPLQPDGTLCSEVFPGLWLDAAAMVALEPARVMAALQQGLAAPEHAAFVERLRQAQDEPEA